MAGQAPKRRRSEAAGPAPSAGFPPLLHCSAACSILCKERNVPCRDAPSWPSGSARGALQLARVRRLALRHVPGSALMSNGCGLFGKGPARTRRARDALRARGGPGTLCLPALLTGGWTGFAEQSHGAAAVLARGCVLRRLGGLAGAPEGGLQVCARAITFGGLRARGATGRGAHGLSPGVLCVWVWCDGSRFTWAEHWHGSRSSPWSFCERIH